MATRIRTFADVDTSSDFDLEDEGPASKSAASLTFRTDRTEGKSVGAPSHKAGRAVTESEGSIMFDSDSDDEVFTPTPAAAAPAPPRAPAPQAEAASPVAALTFAMPTKAVTPATDVAELPQAPPGRQVAEVTSPPPQQKPAARLVPEDPLAVERSAQLSESATSPSQAVSASPQPRPPKVTTAPVEVAAVSLPGGVVLDHDGRLDDDDDQDSFAEAILPSRPTARAAPAQCSAARHQVRILPMQRSTPTRRHELPPTVSAAADDDVNQLLVRAQLRLEEKKRAAGSSAPSSSTPRQRLPSPRVAGHALAVSPRRAESAVRASLTPHLGEAARCSLPGGSTTTLTTVSPQAALQDDAKMRRLTQENARLVAEVNYLNRETQKLRAASGTADTAEAMRLHLTVDMLRKELEEREINRQQERDELLSQVGASAEQVRQLVDQTESYASSAQQYKTLYEEKLRELEDAKTRFQSVLDQVQTVEQRQRMLEQQNKDRLDAERERADRAVANLNDVKQQRDHIQQLNDQLQAEVQRSADERRQLKASLDKADADMRHAREEADRQLDSVREELARLHQTLGEKEKRHAAQLREEQRQQSSLAQRLEQLQADHQEETERLRRTADGARKDAKLLLREERDRRVQAENELRRVTTAALHTTTGSTVAISRDASDVYTATMAAELERRLKDCKAELDSERRARAEAETMQQQAADELDQAQEALAYYQQEVASLADRLAQSEQMRDASDAQRALLQSALDDLMSHDDQQTQHIADLEAALDEQAVVRGHVRDSRARGADASACYDAEQLSAENDRLTSECERLADERDQLLEDNGRIAAELLKWKDEMRRFASSYARTPSSAARKA